MTRLREGSHRPRFRAPPSRRLPGTGFTALVSFALLVGAAPAFAQAGGYGAPETERPPASRMDLAAFGGLMAPLNDLTEDPNSFGTGLAAAPVVGADLSLWMGGGAPGGGGLGLVLQALYAPAELKVRPASFQGAVPTDLGSADYMAATLALAVRLRPGGAARLVEPFVLVGGGLRRLGVDAIAEPEVEDGVDPIGTAAAGARVRVSDRLAIRFELRDHISGYRSASTDEARLQNDLIVTVGLGTRVR